MFTNAMRKFAAKAVSLTMLFSVLAPLASSVTAANPTGNLTTGFNHVEGGYTITNIDDQVIADRDAGDCPYQSNGPNAGHFVCQENLEIGIYTISFNDVPGYDTPADVDIDLNESGGTVLGDYTMQGGGIPNGVLGVAVNHIDAGYIIEDVDFQEVLEVNATQCGPLGQDGFYHCHQVLPIGQYTVKYKDVPGYTTPEDDDVDLDEEGTDVEGEYILNGPITSTLTVGVNHVDGGYTIEDIDDQEVLDVNASDCGPLQPNGNYMCVQELPIGVYTVIPKEVNGYDKPADIDVDLGLVDVEVWIDYELIGPETANVIVNVNLAEAGYVIKDIDDQEVASVADSSECGPLQGNYHVCNQELPLGIYVIEFEDVNGYITPSDIDLDLNENGAELWGYYDINPTGVINIDTVDQNFDPIVPPAGDWELRRCTNENPGTCNEVITSGGAGDLIDGLDYAFYRITFPNPQPPAGYSGRQVIPNVYQEMDGNNTSLQFTIVYTEENVQPDFAYVNVRTTPVVANTRMVTVDPQQADQENVTGELVALNTYELFDADRFTLPTTNGFTASTDYYIECLPTPGDYEAPANPIIVNDAVYAAGSETLAGTCQYTQVPPNETVTITIDTFGDDGNTIVDDAAIDVDAVEQRAEGVAGAVDVLITTTEEHVISFADRAGYITPEDIVIPADTLNPGMLPEELFFLGYYVPVGDLAIAEVNTENQDGWAYITIGADPTLYNVGFADTTATPLIVHFDETVAHGFHFEDKNADNPAFYLRAVPNAAPGFDVAQDIVLNGNDVTYFQENYTYDGSFDFNTPVQLVGDYIAEGDAAFFRARSTNADPVFGEIYLDINGDPTETYIPGAQTFTHIYISDVVNDADTTTFESPLLNILGSDWVASPLNYDHTTFNPGPTVNDLETTYVPDSADIIVQLISFDNVIQPVGGETVTLDQVINEQTVDNGGTIEASFVAVDPANDHNITCPVIPGLQAPNNIYIPADTLQPGQNVFHCLYAPLATSAEILIETEAEDEVNFEAPITLNVDGTDYNIGWTLNDADPQTPAALSLWVDTTRDHVITYGDMPPYITPAAAVVPADTLQPGSSFQDAQFALSNTFNGLYTLLQPGDATFNFFLYELDPNNGPVPNTDVSVNVDVQQTDAQGETTFNNVDVSQAITITFGDHPQGNGIFATPLPINFAANELQPNTSYDFYIPYVPVNFAATLDIETLDEPTQLINVNGGIQLVVNGSQPFLIGYGTAQVIVSTDAQFNYEIDWAPTVPAGQYIEPLDDPHAVDMTGVNPGDTLDIDGLYRLCQSGNCEVVDIIAYDENNQVLNSVTITVDLNPVGNGQHSGTYDVGSFLDINFEDVPTHGTPDIFINNVFDSTSHDLPAYEVVAGQNLIEAFYGINNDSVGFNVGTRDDQGNALTEDITHGPTGTEVTEATPAFFAVQDVDLVDYIINFEPRPGYFAPGQVVVQNQAIANVPADVLITNNGVPYVPGDPLVNGDTYDIIGTYTPWFSIEKNIIQEQTVVNNNKRVDYQIVVTRNAPDAMGPLSINLHDTISDNNRTLNGSNGGTMSVVQQGPDYSICSNGCGDITAGAVDVAIDTQGTQVTIIYQTLSSNGAIPTGQSSDFLNTLTGTIDDNGDLVVITTDATVNVLAAPGNNNNPGNGGGGGGGGGGVIMIQGDMVLEVTKLASLDNVNFADYSDPESPLSIAERVDSTMFTKVNIKNLGQVSAINIDYLVGFDSHESSITSDPIQNFDTEDDGVTYDDVIGMIEIEKIQVGGEVNFTYEQILHENGTQGDLAEEFLQLEGFSTTLKSNQDGLTKFGIGDHYPTWIVAGEPTTVMDGDKLLLSIETDKAAARVGEEVTYKVSAENIADFDMTGLIITWAYDPDAIEVLNPFGGRDTGHEIHWDLNILRPGESVEYQVRTRVKDTAPVGGSVRTTARGLVDQVENPSVVDHYLTIIGGIMPNVPRLAQTGLGSTMILLLASMAAYFLYQNSGRRRYLALKRAALRPL